VKEKKKHFVAAHHNILQEASSKRRKFHPHPIPKNYVLKLLLPSSQNMLIGLFLLVLKVSYHHCNDKKIIIIALKLEVRYCVLLYF